MLKISFKKLVFRAEIMNKMNKMDKWKIDIIKWK